ncbi:MAG: putative metal-binding motif-containing protein [Alphaproteobacteria bacterium]|nr:putative metal-binding motif-containing protein [Alphaproteobacteria bacterium]
MWFLTILACSDPCGGPRFVDQDGDGFGRGRAASCEGPDVVRVGGDCDDHDANVHPGAPEVCDGGVDDDCDPDTVEEEVDGGPVFRDTDRDGFGGERVREGCPGDRESSVGGDCNDLQQDIHPGAAEACNDGIDDDCDPATPDDDALGPLWYVDADLDGFGDPSRPLRTSCRPIGGTSTVATDCDDQLASVNPEAQESCNDRDDDCDGQVDDDVSWWDVFEDADGDGWGAVALGTVCHVERGQVTLSGDCDDTEAAIHPQAEEVCNHVDDDCDGQVDPGLWVEQWPDLDGDLHGDASASSIVDCRTPGWTTSPSDCDDATPTVYEGAPEHCDGLDEDCDGAVDEDAVDRRYLDLDGDGFGRTDRFVTSCDAVGAPSGGDCDDDDATAYPGAVETCGDTTSDCDARTDPCSDTCVWARRGSDSVSLRLDDGTQVASLPCSIDAVDRAGVPVRSDDLLVRWTDPGSGSCNGDWVPLDQDLPDPVSWEVCVGNCPYCGNYDYYEYYGYYYDCDCTTFEAAPEVGRLAVDDAGHVWAPFGLRAAGDEDGGLLEVVNPYVVAQRIPFPQASASDGVWLVGDDRLWLAQGPVLVAYTLPGLNPMADVPGGRVVDALDGRMVVLGDGPARFAGARDGVDLGVFEPLDITSALAVGPGDLLATLPDGSVVRTRGDGVVVPWLPAGSATELVGIAPCP